MTDKRFTDEEIEFLKEQCEFISDEYEKLMANLLKMINSIEEAEAREKFMNMYIDMVKNEPKKPAFLKTAPKHIKK